MSPLGNADGTVEVGSWTAVENENGVVESAGDRDPLYPAIVTRRPGGVAASAR